MRRLILTSAVVLCAIALTAQISYTPPRDPRPILQQADFILAPAAYSNAFSTPIVLVSAVSGQMAILEAVLVYKEAGTAWTTGSGNLQISHTGEGSNSFSIGKAGLFDQAAAETAVGTQTTFASYNRAAHFQDANLVLSLTSANMTGGTGNLRVRLWYRLYPSAF